MSIILGAANDNFVVLDVADITSRQDPEYAKK
jgi:hypothetical protein